MNNENKIYSILNIKAPVTEEQVKPYTENIKILLKAISNEGGLILDLLRFIRPMYNNESMTKEENTEALNENFIKKEQKQGKVDFIDCFIKSKDEILLFFSLITKNKVKLPVDLISNDFKIKHFNELIQFSTTRSITNLQNLSKTMLNITLNYNDATIILKFLENNLSNELKKFENFLISAQQTLDFLEKKIGNISDEETTDLKNNFINDKNEEINNEYVSQIMKAEIFKGEDFSDDEISQALDRKISINSIKLNEIIKQYESEKYQVKQKANQLIEMLKNKEQIITKTKKDIKTFNDLVDNCLNIFRLVDTKKLYDIIQKCYETEKNHNYSLMLESAVQHFGNASQYLISLQGNQNHQTKTTIKDLVMSINFVNESNSSKQQSTQKNNNKKYIIGGLIFAGIVICGAIWYWNSNQNSNIQI